MTEATKTIMIQGQEFTVSTPYAEGHTLTAVEAKVLNQTRCENIRNNQAKAIKTALEDGTYDHDVATAAVAAYDAEYTFASGGGAVRQTLDPVEREARAIARNLLRNQLKADGRKMADVDKDKLASAVEAIAENPDVIKAAKKVVKDREALANVDLSGASV